MQVHYSSKNHNWATPWPVFDTLEEKFGPQADPDMELHAPPPYVPTDEELEEYDNG